MKGGEKMEKGQLWTIVGVALVVAVIASVATASITGNVIKLNQDRYGKYYHPADTNKDWKISMAEYISYKSSIGAKNCNQDHLYCQTAGEIWAFGLDGRYVSLDPYTFFPSGSLNYLAGRWMNEANKNIVSREDYVYAGKSFPICATDTGQLVRCK